MGVNPTLSAPPPSAVRAAGGQVSTLVEETAEAGGARAVGVPQRRRACGRARQGSSTDPLTTDR